jgi:hypothetical protein
MNASLAIDAQAPASAFGNKKLRIPFHLRRQKSKLTCSHYLISSLVTSSQLFHCLKGSKMDRMSRTST